MKSMVKKFKIAEDEYWYPGVVNDGYLFPLGKESKYKIDFAANDTFNQITPVLLSTKGRYVYADHGKVEFSDGIISVDGTVDYAEGYGTLKGAYNAVAVKYYDIRPLPSEMKQVQYQYCTWMALKKDHNQKAVLEYARKLVDCGFPPGLLIIDDSWQRDLGDWEFNDRFEDPGKMIDELHKMGFKVSLWVVPYVSFNASNIDGLAKEGLLMKNVDGSLFVAHSWLGESAVFDLENPQSVDWLSTKFDSLRDRYGVDGFKFDGGDEAFIRGSGRDNVKQNEIWCTFYDCPIIELRSAYKTGGLPQQKSCPIAII